MSCPYWTPTFTTIKSILPANIRRTVRLKIGCSSMAAKPLRLPFDAFYSQPRVAKQASGSRRPGILRFFAPLDSGAGHFEEIHQSSIEGKCEQVCFPGQAVSYSYRWVDEALIARLYEQGSFPDYLFSEEFSIIFLCFILQAASETYRVEKMLILERQFLLCYTGLVSNSGAAEYAPTDGR
jgi:hypothetical protein